MSIRSECGARDDPTKPPALCINQPSETLLLFCIPSQACAPAAHQKPHVVARSEHQNQPHPRIPVSRRALDAEGRQARICENTSLRKPCAFKPLNTRIRYTMPLVHQYTCTLFPRAQRRACTAPSSFLNGGTEDRSPRHRFLATGWMW